MYHFDYHHSECDHFYLNILRYQLISFPNFHQVHDIVHFMFKRYIYTGTSTKGMFMTRRTIPPHILFLQCLFFLCTFELLHHHHKSINSLSSPSSIPRSITVPYLITLSAVIAKIRKKDTDKSIRNKEVPVLVWCR